MTTVKREMSFDIMNINNAIKSVGNSFTCYGLSYGSDLVVISKVCICTVVSCWDDYRDQYDSYGGDWPLLADICQGVSSVLGSSTKILDKIKMCLISNGRCEADNYSIWAI